VRPEGFSDGLELPPGRKTGGAFNSDRVPQNVAKDRQESGTLEVQAAQATAEAEQAAKDLFDINAMALKLTRSMTKEQLERERAEESALNHGKFMDRTPPHLSSFKPTDITGCELKVNYDIIKRTHQQVGAPDQPIDCDSETTRESASSLSRKDAPLTNAELLGLTVYGKTLNTEQSKQMVPMIDCLRGDPDSGVLQPRLLIHGPGGSGKTHFILHLLEIAKLLGQSVSTGAAQASAASNILGGCTIHSMFTLRFKSNDDTDKEQELVPLTHTQVGDLRKRYGLGSNTTRPRVRIVVIDEISQINPFMLCAIHSRLQQIFQSDLEFGGVAVILLGDFYQMRPVMGDSLSNAVMTEAKADASISTLTGRRLFPTFTIGCFTAEERAKGDKIWASFTRRVRDHGKLLKQDLHHIKVLTDEEASNDWRWFFAPVACGSNAQRHEINAAQAVRFAKRAGKPVIQWVHTFNREKFGNAKLTDEQRNSLYVRDRRFSTYFVEGAPAYIKKNITADATMKGICNGTMCKMHSLTFSSDESLRDRVMEVRQQIARAKPGEIVVIMMIPLSINVELFLDTDPQDQREEPALVMPLQFRHRLLQPVETLVSDRFVIPILQTTKQKGDFVRIEGRRGEVISGIIYQDDFELELGFAMTYHKAQGRTIPRLIVDLNKTTQPPFLLYEVLYVALTRVQMGSHLRCLPSCTGDFNHLLNLSVRPTTLDWLHGFDQTGYWTIEMAKSRKQPPGLTPQVPFGCRNPPVSKPAPKVKSLRKKVAPLSTTLSLWAEYFDPIISGRKTVEGRIAYSSVSNIRVNHLIKFTDRKDKSRPHIVVRVTAIRHYFITDTDPRDPIEQFLLTENLSKCSPGKTALQTQTAYRNLTKLKGANDHLQTHGFLAFEIEVVKVGGVTKPPLPITPTFIPELAPSRKRPAPATAERNIAPPARAAAAATAEAAAAAKAAARAAAAAATRAAAAAAAAVAAAVAVATRKRLNSASYHEQMRAALRISLLYANQTSEEQFDRETQEMINLSLIPGGKSNESKVDDYLTSLHKTRLKVLGDGNCGIYSLFLSFYQNKHYVSVDEGAHFRKDLTDYGRQHAQDANLMLFWSQCGGSAHYREYDDQMDDVTLEEHYRVGSFITKDKNWIGLMEILICARMLARDIVIYSVIDGVTGDNPANCRYSTRDWDPNAVPTGLPPLEIAAVNRNHYDCVRPALITISSDDELPQRQPRPKIYDMTPFQYDELSTMTTDLATQTRKRVLSDAEVCLTTRALATGGASIVNTRSGIDISCQKLRCLTGTTWLNDEVINYFFKLIEKRSYQPLAPKRIKVLSTFFYTQMTEHGYSYIETNGRTGLNNYLGHVFEGIDLLMFPVHVSYVRKSTTIFMFTLVTNRITRFAVYRHIGS
jgi:ASC-1-like (ASCH) protein